MFSAFERTLGSSARDKILLVDDQPLNLELLRCYLESDYDVFVAGSGVEAIQQCESIEPDIILLDVNMPQMDGLETCRTLKQNPYFNDTPIVFVTAMTTEQEQQSCWDAGGDDYIPKPVHKASLRNRVRAQLNARKRSHNQRRSGALDSITQLPTRDLMEDYLQFQTKLALKNRIEMSLVLFGIDDYEKHLTYYGSEANEVMLSQVAFELREVFVDSINKVFCHSDGVFCAVLPETNRAEAWQYSSKVLNAMNIAAIPHLTSEKGHVTISAGLASLIDAGFDQHNIMSLAQKNLRSAKRRGGNNIAGWSPTGFEYI
ncbi:response regulator [Alteromonas sp. ASW11-36]|uniref:Response regulator n=1 Tax=Alteromonas arenosi TaxID=3055817 RepID=A0ABT7T0I7_9ALTE|nr:response regulator [Alteromonas sp. ASW11-36]MDM7861332.1 response regulator [Alteromonas sp. ASW11-36]